MDNLLEQALSEMADEAAAFLYGLMKDVQQPLPVRMQAAEIILRMTFGTPSEVH